VAPWSAHLFSEGTALHLWQIRHIPNRPQTLLKLTVVASACILGVVSLSPIDSYVVGQDAGGSIAKKESDQKPSPAAELLERVRQELPKHLTIQADLTQQVSIGDQQFKTAGHYVQAGNKLAIRYTVNPDQGAHGEMLEVCDGKELWTLLTLSDSKRVTRRNVQQILAAAAAASKRDVPEAALNVEMGLGGITALLASLDRMMVFDVMKEEEIDGQKRTVIQGHWKKDLAQRFPKDKDDLLPPFVPDLVRVYINSRTLFPEKLLYLKKQATKKTFKPLVSLEFRNAEFDRAVDEEMFVFRVPDNIVPEDVTKVFIDRLSGPAEGASPRK
jgi:outer membrane lipoprotein-sorting protein